MDKDALSKYMADIGRKGGLSGSKKLTKAQRRERAKKAVAAREAKRKAAKK